MLTSLFQLHEYKTMFAVLLLCLVGIAVAQVPQPCITPPSWEGRIFDSNEQRHVSLFGRISYDAVYHRTRLIETIEAGSEELILMFSLYMTLELNLFMI